MVISFFCSINMQSTGMSPEAQGGYAEFVKVGLPESILKSQMALVGILQTLVEPLAVGLHGRKSF